jgi:hypothetical protein
MGRFYEEPIVCEVTQGVVWTDKNSMRSLTLLQLGADGEPFLGDFVKGVFRGEIDDSGRVA